MLVKKKKKKKKRKKRKRKKERIEFAGTNELVSSLRMYPCFWGESRLFTGDCQIYDGLPSAPAYF